MRVPALILIAILAGCATAPPATTPSVTAAAAGASSEFSRIVDLTHTLDEKTISWPTSPATFKLEKLAYGKTAAGYFYAANSFSMPEHAGTHLDAPIHFAENRWTADQIPVDRLVGPGVVISVEEKAAADRDYRLTPDDLIEWERQHGRIPEGAIVLLRTGWSKRWPDQKAYMGDDVPGYAGNLHFPAYGANAARFLVEERKVAGLGVDTASIDHGPSSDFIVHQIANGANVFGLENLTNLDQLPAKGSTIVALPAKIGGGSGGPVRVIALIP